MSAVSLLASAGWHVSFTATRGGGGAARMPLQGAWLLYGSGMGSCGAGMGAPSPSGCVRWRWDESGGGYRWGHRDGVCVTWHGHRQGKWLGCSHNLRSFQMARTQVWRMPAAAAICHSAVAGVAEELTWLCCWTVCSSGHCAGWLTTASHAGDGCVWWWPSQHEHVRCCHRLRVGFELSCAAQCH